MHKIKVLFVIGSLDLGGTEMHLLRLLPKFPKDEFEIILFTISKGGALKESFEKKHVKVVSPTANSIFNNLRYLKLCASFFRLIKLILNFKPTTIHFFLPEAYLFGSFCAFITRQKCLVMSRRSMNHYQKKYPFLGIVERNLHKKMSVVLANSNAVKKNLEEEGMNGKDIKVIYNGIKLEEYDQFVHSKTEIRKKLNIRKNSLVLIMVANLIGYKGHENLLNSLAKIKNQLPKGWNLICIGRDDGILNQLKKNTKMMGLGQNVIWIDSCKEVASFLNASDIGILCSHEEGFSNSVLEGMAAKLPMVVTSVGGNAEAIVNNENGFVVPARDDDELGQAILKLSNNKGLRTSFGNRSHHRVSKLFTLERCINDYCSVYRDLCNEKL